MLDEGPTARDLTFYARVGLAHAQRLREHAVRELGPALPLLVAGSIDEHFCLLHLAAMTCRTIGEVVQLTVARWRYMTDAFPARAVRRDGAVHLQFDVPGSAPLGARVGVEYLLATIACASSELSGGEWRPSAIVLGHRPPVALSAWEDACGVPVHVGEAPGLVIAQSALGQPVRAGLSPTAGPFFRELLDCHTPRLAPTLAERVAAALGRDLGAVAPTVEQVAAELGTSARSLHRQLAAEGTSYQRVLDSVRCDEAIRQAVDEQRPFKAIAAAVGFADPRAFRRRSSAGPGPRRSSSGCADAPANPVPGNQRSRKVRTSGLPARVPDTSTEVR